MKVLLTSDTFYPMVNGVVISMMNLYKELKKLGNDVRILVLSDTGEEKIDGDIYYLRSFKVKIYPDSRIKSPFHNYVLKELIDWRPDVVHTQTEFSVMLAAKHIVRKTGALHFHTYHTMYEDYLSYLPGGRFIRPKAAGKMIKMILNRVDSIIVPTHKVMNSLMKYGIKKEISVIPTGIDLSRFKIGLTNEEKYKMLHKNDISQDDKLIVYVGRIAQEKNIQEIMIYFNNMKLKKFKLLIVGGGPYLEELKNLASDYGVTENVKFTGMVPQEDVAKYYKLGQVFLTASTSETQGLTYIEALASGVPIICRYDKCIEDVVVNGVTGYTYTCEAEFRQYINEVINNEEKREKMAINALNMAEEYSCETFGQNVYNLYMSYSNELQYV